MQNQTSGTPSRRLKRWIRELPVQLGSPDVQKSAGTSALDPRRPMVPQDVWRSLPPSGTTSRRLIRKGWRISEPAHSQLPPSLRSVDSKEEESEVEQKGFRYNPTLYWNPHSFTFEEQKISHTFESTIIKSSYNIVVQGIDKNGNPLYAKKSISVY